MAATPKEIRQYLLPDGRSPFRRWFRSLKDRRARARIRVRLDHVALGNMGDSRSAGDGVQELRIDYGPGYRIYFGQDGETLVLLLCGGTKQGQRRDIAKAREYWKDYRRRRR